MSLRVQGRRRTVVDLEVPAAGPGLRVGLQPVLQKMVHGHRRADGSGDGVRGLTRYTVMGWSWLKVMVRAGLELYFHLDSTKRSRAALAWSSEMVGTLRNTQVLGSAPLRGSSSGGVIT